MDLIDKVNVLEFNTGYEKGKYICTNCHEIVGLSDSVSHMGYNLVCNRCLWRIEHITGIHPLANIQKIGKMREERQERITNDATSI